MDLDGTGRLALVILNYVVFGPKEPQYCETGGIKSGCPPESYKPEFAEMWERSPDGVYRDITSKSGLKRTSGKALVVAFADADDDGSVDFYIGNDGTPAEYMHNVGGLRFENLGQRSGLYASSMSKPIAAMGADWADYNGDGRLDLVVSAFSNESYALFKNMGANLFTSAEEDTNLAGPTLKPLGFGAKWADVDNDGWPDIMFANGHVYDNVSLLDPSSTFRQPIMIFRNEAGRGFQDLVPSMPPDIQRPLVGRGSAVIDFDNDGRPDTLIVDYEGRPMLLHNASETKNHWITLDLRNSTGNRFAYGAKVELTTGKRKWVAIVSPASSYLSSSDPRIHFGLGNAATVDHLSVRWPDGSTELFHNLRADSIYRILRGHNPAPLTYAPSTFH